MSLNSSPHSSVRSVLRSQRRTTQASSVMIAILTIILIGILLYAISLDIETPRTRDLISYSSTLTEEPIEEVEAVNQVEQPPSPASSSMAKVIASSMPTAAAIPVTDFEMPELSLDFGADEEFSESFGESPSISTGLGTKASNNFRSLPIAMKNRCSRSARLKRLKKSGGTPQCEDAVVKALEWMQSTQKRNGSWTRGKKVGMTGLSLLAYLGHCETPASEQFGTTVEKAIIYLINVGMKNDGLLASDLDDRHWPYEHAIATYALAEAYTLCKQANITIPNLQKTVEDAGLHILKHQHTSSGGWDYSYATSGKRGGDSSITCWQLQALKACRQTKLKAFRDITKSSNKALRYLENCQRKDGGIYYETRKAGAPFPTMTGGAMLCFQQWGKPKHSLVRKGSKYISKNIQFSYLSEDSDLYAHYYYSQALLNLGGRVWDDYNSQFRDELLQNQHSNGSWNTPGVGHKIKGSFTKAYTAKSKKALHYRTCLATLMLEVYYRYLPGSR